MIKRQFLSTVAGGAGLIIGSLLVYRSNFRIFYRKVKGRLKPRSPSQSPAIRHFAQLPQQGETVSVELALNSRCSSDQDGDPTVFHWGMFDGDFRLSEEQVARVARLSGHCQFSDHENGIKIEGNTLKFLVSPSAASGFSTTAMVGSGVQQQAVNLACAALGIGIRFRELGLDGRLTSSGKLAAVTMQLDAAKPSYQGSFWTAACPGSECPWLPGNLPEPQRNSKKPLIQSLQGLAFNRPHGTAATRAQIGQVLWAARGRTPHLYKSQPWGLTIPTWQGIQDVSAVYIASGPHLYRYVNWRKGRPTHSLEPVSANNSACLNLRKTFAPWNCFVILGTDDPHARGLWEVGYQLLNVLVQASGFGTGYQTIMLADDQSATFAKTSIKRPVVAIAFSLADEKLL